MIDVLGEILAHKRRQIAGLPDCTRSGVAHSDRDFAASLRTGSRAIIAEIKQRSPSGWVAPGDFRPAVIARKYEEGGAAALSVLTDAEYFGGHPAHLTEARHASSLPVLRKDFILDPRQVTESRQMGADACLLIVAALELDELTSLKSLIEDLGMDALVEVNNHSELETALVIGSTMIAINNRNLRDLSIDHGTTDRLCSQVPADVTVVSASGMANPEDVHRLPERVNAVLIGTALMHSDNPTTFLKTALYRNWDW